jgi:MtN3 and saliva related transmembrane protein
MADFHLPGLHRQLLSKWKNNPMPNLNWIDYLGLFGAFLSSITFLPQVYKAWKTKSVGDLSIWMILILLANVSTWLIYGLIKNDFAIIIANSIILFLSFLMLFFKFSFKK